ncbi:MAG TPA: outer membrane beta-barrel protein [Bacteroidia bacterium]|jgi:hypothetical protein|nr:outer membrane beta-barrel protein [Bacteroidia bacterium]
MKKLLLLLFLFSLTHFSFAQVDTSSKISLLFYGNVIGFPVADKNIATSYDTYYGIGGIGVSYNISNHISVEGFITNNDLTMINQKDFVKSNYPNLYNIYYSYSGGNMQFTVISTIFRYNFLNHSRWHIYITAGPTYNFCNRDAITGNDVRIAKNTSAISPAIAEGAIGFRFGLGCSYQISKKLTAFAQADYTSAFVNKVNPSAIGQLPIYLGITYSF